MSGTAPLHKEGLNDFDSGQGHPSPRIADLMEGVYDIKVHIVKAMVFPVVMYRCESWTIKKAKNQRTDASNCGAGEDSWTVRKSTSRS